MKKKEIIFIKDEKSYKQALKMVEPYFGLENEDDIPEDEWLWVDAMVTLIEKYEQRHHSIPSPDPIEAIKFTMEQQGLSRKDLVPYIGQENRVSEILNGKRSLSLNMIKKLHKGLHIPLEVLIQI